MKGEELKQHLLDRGFKWINENVVIEGAPDKWCFQYSDGQTNAVVIVQDGDVGVALENLVTKESMEYYRDCEGISLNDIEIWQHQLDKMIEAMGIDL